MEVYESDTPFLSFYFKKYSFFSQEEPISNLTIRTEHQSLNLNSTRKY